MNSLEILAQVYEKKKYYLLTFVVAVTCFIIFYKLMLINIANHSLKNFIIMSGYNSTFFTLLSFVIISILFGIYICLVTYKFNLIKAMKKKKGNSISFWGYFGLIAGVFGAGCPSCGSLMFAFFGAPLALMYFPFKGFELRILSIIILIIAIYFLGRSINNSCKIKQNI